MNFGADLKKAGIGAFLLLVVGLLVGAFAYAPSGEMAALLTSKPAAKPEQFQAGSQEITYKDARYHVFIADLNEVSIKMHWRDASGELYGSIGSLLDSEAADGTDPLLITNGGMYLENRDPQGLFIEDGIQRKKIELRDTDKPSNFFMKPNGVFFIDENGSAGVRKTESFHEFEDIGSVQFATQSGPQLLIDGKMHPAFNEGSKNRKLRSGVGIINNRKIVFAISRGNVNFFDFASLFEEKFGCKNALYLDGVISRMYLQDLNPAERGGRFGPLISVSPK